MISRLEGAGLHEKDLTMIGLVFINDPLRADVPEALRVCRQVPCSLDDRKLTELQRPGSFYESQFESVFSIFYVIFKNRFFFYLFKEKDEKANRFTCAGNRFAV